MKFTGVHFNWQGTQMCWKCGLRIPSGDVMSCCPVLLIDRSAQVMYMCIHFDTTIPHRDAGVCDLQTTVRRVLQSTQWQCRWLCRCMCQKCMLSVLYLCRECLYSQTTHGWKSLRHLFMWLESSVETTVSCGTECAASRLTCDTCYHCVFLSFCTRLKWLLKAIIPSRIRYSSDSHSLCPIG